jgi:SAM-dependent methyltransferase
MSRTLLVDPFKYETSDLEALSDLTNYYQWIVDEIRPCLGARLAEIGAGIGTFTHFLIAGHIAHQPVASLRAFEPAANLYPVLQRRLHERHADLVDEGRVVAQSDYFRGAPGEFDTVILVNVLEHIEDDLACFREVHAALSPGGRIVIFVPALRWLFSELDRAVGHYRRYHKNQLHQALEASNFKIIKSSYFDVLGVLPWYLLNVLGRATTVNPRLARLYDRVGVPLTRWVEQLYSPAFGKNLLLIGEKR